MTQLPLVIFAEDDDLDWLLVEETLDQCHGVYEIERVKNGEELLDRLENTSKRRPSLIMLDLRMPRIDGIEALESIKNNAKLRHIPVIMMTTSKLESDIMSAYAKGANSYVVKPVKFEDMNKALKDLHHYWTKVVTLPSEGAPTA